MLKSAGFLFEISSMKFEFVIKSRSAPGSRRPILRPVADSKIELITDTRGADVTIMKEFQKPISKFFTARTSVQPTRGGYKISITLQFKPEVLRRLN